MDVSGDGRCPDVPILLERDASRQHEKQGRTIPPDTEARCALWLYLQFAKPGYKILDTHLGSGSSRIAAYDAGLDFWGYEIDKEYFDKQEERFAIHTSQVSMFESF